MGSVWYQSWRCSNLLFTDPGIQSAGQTSRQLASGDLIAHEKGQARQERCNRKEYLPLQDCISAVKRDKLVIRVQRQARVFTSNGLPVVGN
jgi:hypothetical protein